MKSEADFRPYQHKMIQHIVAAPFCGVYADMGLGKTSTTLTAILRLLRGFEVNKVLVVAPLRVTRKTWTDEIEEWSHLANQFHGVSKILGTPRQRLDAIEADAELYLINRENFVWLCNQYKAKSANKFSKPWPWDMVVIDESTSFKSRGSERWKAWRRVRSGITRMVHLTGSPAPKGLKDLWAQIFMLDGGVRLGTSKQAFEDRWFNRVMKHPRDQYGTLEPKPSAEKEIHQLVSDICISLKAEDYLDLPDVVYNWVTVSLDKAQMGQYRQMMRTYVLELKDKTIAAVNAGVLAGKLLQLANGAIYTKVPKWEEFHKHKLDALSEILEETSDKVIIVYQFKSDLARIMNLLKGQNVRKLETERDEDDWNSGKIDYLLLHPACLHPSTEVLTEKRGWIRIIDTRKDERVFDGVEFVSHKGCNFAGRKPVIKRFGVTLTHNHKLLINGEWVEAKNVQDTEETQAKASYGYEGNDPYLGRMLPLQKTKHALRAECDSSEQSKKETLSPVHKRNIPPYDRYTNMEHLAEHACESCQPLRQGLPPVRWSGQGFINRMVRFQKLLRGYVFDLRRLIDFRPYRQFAGVFERKLPMGHQHAAAVQQRQQSSDLVQKRIHALSRILQGNWRYSRGNHPEVKQRDVCRRSLERLSKFDIQEKSSITEVYDLVDCGPRNRFLIRNKAGDVFVSHNSAGHGLNLQHGGSTIVWFGLNFSLELYDQTNARLIGGHRRIGKNAIVHHIVAENTYDDRVREILSRDEKTQNDLMSALKLEISSKTQ